MCPADAAPTPSAAAASSAPGSAAATTPSPADPAPAAAAASPRLRRQLVAAVLDLARDSPAELRRKAGAALAETVSPCFYVTGFGFDVRPALRAAEHHFTATGCAGERRHFDLRDTDVSGGEALDAFRADMHRLARRVAGIVFGDARTATVLDGEAAGPRAVLAGPLSVKNYSGTAECRTRLGAHVDGNMFTLLWSNAPGLQVLRPSADTVAFKPHDLMMFGMPMIGAGPMLSFKDDDYANVVLPPGYDMERCMLFTVGRSWFSQSNMLAGHTGDDGESMSSVPQCPVLHRVAFDDRPDQRWSIPFLVNCEEA